MNLIPATLPEKRSSAALKPKTDRRLWVEHVGRAGVVTPGRGLADEWYQYPVEMAEGKRSHGMNRALLGSLNVELTVRQAADGKFYLYGRRTAAEA